MKKPSLLTSQFSPLTSERGFMFVAIILIMLVIFSISIVSGAGNFAFSPDPTEKSSPSTGPTATPSAGTITPTPANTAGWKITTTFLGCDINEFPKADINSTGSENGYIKLEISDVSGFREIATANFLSPVSKNTATLLNSLGFNTKAWRVSLYSGGSPTNNRWSGGNMQATVSGNPTGCP